MFSEAKKLVLVLAASTLMTRTRKETVEIAEVVEIAEAVGTAGISKDGKKSKGKYPENPTSSIYPVLHHLPKNVCAHVGTPWLR